MSDALEGVSRATDAASPWPLLTERLLIRPAVASDWPAFLSWRSLPEVVLHEYQKPWTAEFAEKRVAEWAERQTLEAPGDAIQLVIALQSAPAAVLGELMLKRSEGREQGEIGWTVHPDAQGHGYASESARALLAIAFTHFGLHRVHARLDEDNPASARVCERLGMRLEARLVENDWRPGDGTWTNELDYAILASEFLRD